MLVLSRRYRCFHPACPRVKEMVVRKMATTHGEGNIYVGDGVDKRNVSDDERAAMRKGELEGIPADTIRKLISGGWSFGIDSMR